MNVKFLASIQRVSTYANSLLTAFDGRFAKSEKAAWIYWRSNGRALRPRGQQSVAQIHWRPRTTGHEFANAISCRGDDEHGRQSDGRYRLVSQRRRDYRNSFIEWICAALVLFSAGTPAYADNSIHFEAGIGGSASPNRGDGYWFQEPFPHKMQMAAPSFEVGVTGDVWQRGNLGLSWHADWAWLGTIHTSAQATPSDANYSLKNKSCVGPCWPMSTFNGSGHDQGFLFTLEPFYMIGDYRLAVEAGPYIHKSVWSETIPDWRPTADATPRPLSVQNQNRWRLGSVIGASISKGNFTLSYQYFANRDPLSDDTGAIWASTHMVMLKYKF